MARYTGERSEYDERSQADSSSPSSAHRVEEGRLSFGRLSSADDNDWYQLRIPGPGAYRLVLSWDPANAQPGEAWNPLGGAFLLLADRSGEPLYQFGFSVALEGGDSALGFVWTGIESLTTTYVYVEGLYGQGANYVLTLQRQGTVAESQFQGTTGIDWLGGWLGNDTILGDAGDDFLVGGPANDVLDGGPGEDTAWFADAPGPVTVDLAAGRAVGTDGTDVLRGIEVVVGSRFNDTLIGSAEADTLDGAEGDDQLQGGAGDDLLQGGPDDDTLDGGPGRDTALYDGYASGAVIRFDPASGLLVVTVPGEGTDQLRDVEVLEFLDRTVETRPYTDRTPPVIVASTPDEGSTGAPVQAPIELTFDEPVSLGSGTIVLRTTQGETVAVYNVLNSANLSVNGRRLTIDPSLNLAGNTSYRVDLAPGTVKDEAGNPFAGGSRTFTTGVAPPEFSVADASVRESGGNLVFTVTLTQALAEAATLSVALESKGTAVAGVDYQSRSATLNFAPGQTRAFFSVPVVDDALFEPTEVLYLRISAPSAGITNQDVAQGRIIDDDDPSPTLRPNDPLYPLQWYLFPGIGANVLPVWAEYTGRGVKVALFDQGIDATHPDLSGNLATAFGRNADDPSRVGGLPLLEDDNHGTAVAGVVAAQRNGVGTVGVAYGATLVSYYSPLDASFTQQSIVNVFDLARSVDVLNDSWGYAPQYVSSAPWAFFDNFRTERFAAAGAALKTLADSGRGGLGTVVVQSAGNSYRLGDDTNLHNFQNSRYIVTVGATDFLGEVTSYSSPGASVLLAAPGGGGGDPLSDILTTDRQGLAGYEPGDVASIRGTSFSAPVVSGVVALMLEANPQLGWRDVQLILANSAVKSGAAPRDWRYNGAGHWNGGGMHFDADGHDLGFGLVDALAAVRLAESWGRQPSTSANLHEASLTRATPEDIPDLGSVTQTLTLARSIEIERVEVTLRATHTYVGDLSLELRSPAGTTSWLLSRPGLNDARPYGTSQEDVDFTFTTVLSMGEDSAGEWALTVHDGARGDTGRLESWTLNVIGREASQDDVYLFTNEYAASAAGAPGRNTLVDSAGMDTLNAAAVTGASHIDLRPGARSEINAQVLTIGASSWIEDAIGGDGADVLIGNARPNRLSGMRGHDVLEGGGGDDTLDGGTGLDTARFAGRRADHAVARDGQSWRVEDRSGQSGTDLLSGIERLQFADLNIALDVHADAPAGQTAQIVRALFGPSYLAVPAYVGAGMRLLANGMGYADLVALAVATPEFAQLAGSRSHGDFVRLVYRNVVGSAPGPDQLAQFVSLLDSGAHTQASLALLACQTTLNTQSAELVGLASTGIDYLPG